MFKKSLLALAMTAVTFGASATLTATSAGKGTALIGGTVGAQLISLEGSVNETSVSLGAVTVLVGTAADVSNLAKVKVTLTGGVFAAGVAATLGFVDADGAADVTDLEVDGSIDYSTPGVALITLDAGELAATVAAYTTGDSFVIGGLEVSPTGGDFVSTSSISYTVELISSIGGAAAIDSVKTVVAVVVPQLASSVTAKFGNATTDKIDVGNARLDWESGKTDSLTVTLTSSSVNHHSVDATAEPASYVLTGDFSFLDADATLGVDTGTVATSTTTPVVSTDFTTITEVSGNLTFDGTAAQTATETFTITVDGVTHILAPQSFSVAAEFDYDPESGSSETYEASLSGGSWSLNGASSFVPFMPFSSAFSQLVSITNTGTVAGAITVDWTSAGVKASTVLTAVATANSVTDISTELRALAAANGITGDAALNIVVDSPSANISVSALYYSKADQDRAVVAVK